jgi:hypothetical protein
MWRSRLWLLRGPHKVLFIGGIHGDEAESAVATAELPAAFDAAGFADLRDAGSHRGHRRAAVRRTTPATRGCANC